MKREACIWYEVDAAQDDAVRSRFDDLIQAMAAFTDEPPRLLRRADLKHRDDRLMATWMEVWRLPDGERATDCIEQIAGHAGAIGLSALAVGGRHVEVFVSQPSSRRII
jgi:hypothetical protein